MNSYLKITMPVHRSFSEGGNGRVYDPKLARFLNPDPVIANPTFTQDYNVYSYVRNNPLGYVDPSGYQLAPYYMRNPDEYVYMADLSSWYGGGSGGGGMPQFGRDGINTNDEWEFAWGSWEAERSGDYTFVNQFLRNHDTPEDRAKNDFKRIARLFKKVCQS
jgi:hypothetical protein